MVSKKVLSLIIITILVAIMGFFAYKLYSPRTGYVSYQALENPTVFEGRITNMKVAPGKIEGVSAYDRNCVGQPITECDGGVRTVEYGVLNFHYRHDMSKEPCIHMYGPEKMIVEILDSNGNAKVTRTQDFSSMGGHHG